MATSERELFLDRRPSLSVAMRSVLGLLGCSDGHMSTRVQGRVQGPRREEAGELAVSVGLGQLDFPWSSCTDRRLSGCHSDCCSLSSDPQQQKTKQNKNLSEVAQRGEEDRKYPELDVQPE